MGNYTVYDIFLNDWVFCLHACILNENRTNTLSDMVFYFSIILIEKNISRKRTSNFFQWCTAWSIGFQLRKICVGTFCLNILLCIDFTRYFHLQFNFERLYLLMRKTVSSAFSVENYIFRFDWTVQKKCGQNCLFLNPPSNLPCDFLLFNILL